MKQLTLDGREVHACQASRAMHANLSHAQSEVLRHIGEHGSITPAQAGRILYADVRADESRYRYASTDGAELLRRLALRGLVHREAPGDWRAGGPVEPMRRRRSESRRP